MQKEKLSEAIIILEEERWEKPRMGTDKQHQSLRRQAKILRYTSVQQFLNAWPAYRDRKINIQPDGGLDKTQAHWLFLHLRRVARNLRAKMELKDY